MYPPYRPRSTTGKQPRHKTESSSVKIESPIKIESASQPSSNVPASGQSITRPNFLGSTVSPIKPNYQSVLVNPFDPFKTNEPSQQSKPNFRKSSPYVLRTSHNIVMVEPHMSHVKNPMTLVKHYCPPNFFYIPHHVSHTLQFFRDILFKTGSVTIKGIYDPNDSSKLLYHSLYIVNIISGADWKDPPFTFHKIGDLTFNYYDYEDAWFKIFMHQTEDFSHSWFINFDHKFNRKFPMWFGSWWGTHGCPISLLPQHLEDVVTSFSTAEEFSDYDKLFPVTLHFIARYKVPWILKWHVELNDYVLNRKYLVKWWDKFKTDRIITAFNKDFPVQVTSPVSPTTLPAQITPHPAQIIPTSPIIQTTPNQASSSKSKGKAKEGSSSKSSKPSSKSSKPKKLSSTEVFQMAHQLMAQAVDIAQLEAQSNSEDEQSSCSHSSSSHNSSHSSGHSRKSTQSSRQLYLLPDSQDPYSY